MLSCPKVYWIHYSDSSDWKSPFDECILYELDDDDCVYYCKQWFSTLDWRSMCNFKVLKQLWKMTPQVGNDTAGGIDCTRSLCQKQSIEMGLFRQGPFGDLRFKLSRFDTERHIDWCCFYYCVRNSLVALLEALCAQICSSDPRISVFPDIFFWFVQSLIGKEEISHIHKHTHTSTIAEHQVGSASVMQCVAAYYSFWQCVAGKNQAATNTWIRVMTWVMGKISAHVRPQTGPMTCMNAYMERCGH
jgi:hypothetical protein